MSHPQNFVIVGGGTAGWMAACALSRLLLRPHRPDVSITLVESEEIGIVGVGEATIPSIHDLLRFLNIDETDFIRKTDATFKLAIRFCDWQSQGEHYWHPFGTLGPTIENVPMFQHWMRARATGGMPGALQTLSICSQLAEGDRFAKPQKDSNNVLDGLGYALHFDANLVARYLRGYGEEKGVQRLEGLVTEVLQDESGAISQLVLKDGRKVTGDFFIDCSGFSALLIEKALGSEFDDWSHWLPCDRAVAVPCENTEPLNPYTKATARAAGWTWRIPLQSRVGNGYVYSSRFCEQDQATQTLLDSLNAKTLAEPRHLRFKPGRRKESWVKNCLALGLASGFLEPLESTNIHFVFSNLFRFFDNFPGSSESELLRRNFNRRCVTEVEETRDFIIAHYCLSERRDSEFWRHVTSMPLPDSLRDRIDLFKRQGRLTADHYDLFKSSSWISILDGMGVIPASYDPLVDTIPAEFSARTIRSIQEAVSAASLNAPMHGAYFGRQIGASRPG